MMRYDTKRETGKQKQDIQKEIRGRMKNMSLHSTKLPLELNHFHYSQMLEKG
jgi:hypothetical protein